jgi:hypothetical protein
VQQRGHPAGVLWHVWRITASICTAPAAVLFWCVGVQVCINAGILLAYCAGIPYEQGFSGFDVLGGNVWLAWWRVMLALALLPAVLQVCVCVALG